MSNNEGSSSPSITHETLSFTLIPNQNSDVNSCEQAKKLQILGKKMFNIYMPVERSL